ncbi:MAG TPA: hypothetical protein VKD72_03550 [Gemmataceae bacterium]|nr:hypothetical protein [Gemmataceae bacterium]
MGAHRVKGPRPAQKAETRGMRLVSPLWAACGAVVAHLAQTPPDERSGSSASRWVAAGVRLGIID